MDRILNNIERIINKNYVGYNLETSIKPLAKAYVSKYLKVVDKKLPFSTLIIICQSCFFISIKYLIDRDASVPTLNNYSILIGANKEDIIKIEMSIATAFNFNFTP